MEFNNFEKFIFRCPIFPLTNIYNDGLTKIEEEAIFLASPDFLTEYNRNGSSRKNLKMKLTALKYKIRMRTRCTPFGLFAGCGVGDIDDKSGIILEGPNSYKSHTRLDMEFLCSLLQSMSSIKDQLTYYPSTSLYKILDSYRYVEYHYLDTQRKHDLIELESDIYLEKVLELCEKGCHYSGIIANLNKYEDLEENDIKEYVDTLIESQVLISNLYPRVTGEDLLQHIIQVLNEYMLAPEIMAVLKKITNQLNYIDSQNVGRNLCLYKEIENDIKSLNIAYQRQYLFQTDTNVQPVSAKLSKEIVESIKEGVEVLNNLTLKIDDPRLSDFAKEFYSRYEDEEIPLIEALDPDIGIGFSNLIPGNVDFHPLIDQIPNNAEIEDPILEMSQVDLFFLEKYTSCLEKGEQIITISEDDIKQFSHDITELPITFLSTFEVVRAESNNAPPLIILYSVGGSSAANLITRFSHINPEIENYVKSITQKEEELVGPLKIIAELVHLPESRTGNVLFRPSVRKFEIPYLAKESVKEEFKIPITDLLVSVKEGKSIILRSQKLKKEIIPRLTTAHNFAKDTLPIYNFLGCFQAYNLKANLSFTWGHFFSKKRFLPRVMYKNIIFFLAQWNFEKKDTFHIPDINNKTFLDEVAAFKKKNNLPNLVSLVRNDIKLQIDFTLEMSVILLFTEVKNKDFTLEEVIKYNESPLIKNESNSYRNEIMLGFYKKEKKS